MKTKSFALFAAGLLCSAGFCAAAPNVDANGTTLPPAEGSEDEAAELAKQLQNPVASLISVPFQNNFEFNLGPNEGGPDWGVRFIVTPLFPTGGKPAAQKSSFAK